MQAYSQILESKKRTQSNPFTCEKCSRTSCFDIFTLDSDIMLFLHVLPAILYPELPSGCEAALELRALQPHQWSWEGFMWVISTVFAGLISGS